MSDGTQKGAAMTTWRKRALSVLLVLAALSAAGCSGIPGGGDTPAIPLPAPKRPKGPDTGAVGQALTYTTKGTDPLEVHDYMWDWGDGAELKWKSKAWERTHAFAAADANICYLKAPPPPTKVQITNSQYPWPEVWKEADTAERPNQNWVHTFDAEGHWASENIIAVSSFSGRSEPCQDGAELARKTPEATANGSERGLTDYRFFLSRSMNLGNTSAK